MIINLHGYSGTGKTTFIPHLTQALQDTCPDGRAVRAWRSPTRSSPRSWLPTMWATCRTPRSVGQALRIHRLMKENGGRTGVSFWLTKVGPQMSAAHARGDVLVVDEGLLPYVARGQEGMVPADLAGIDLPDVLVYLWVSVPERRWRRVQRADGRVHPEPISGEEAVHDLKREIGLMYFNGAHDLVAYLEAYSRWKHDPPMDRSAIEELVEESLASADFRSRYSEPLDVRNNDRAPWLRPLLEAAGVTYLTAHVGEDQDLGEVARSVAEAIWATRPQART